MDVACMMEPYSTHLVPTITAAIRSGVLWPDLPILELGCGHYSTPLLASIAKMQQRKLHLISSDPKWAEFFQKDSQNISIIEGNSWPDVSLSGDWGMVLVDNEQYVYQRFAQLFKLHENAKIVVFHDANRIAENEISWGPIQILYKYVYFFDRYSPSTAILSNFVDPSSWFE